MLGVGVVGFFFSGIKQGIGLGLERFLSVDPGIELGLTGVRVRVGVGVGVRVRRDDRERSRDRTRVDGMCDFEKA